ncbi:MAG TPA: glycosyltransferase family 4 protein [Gammaproteobacteria bacterium]|nr:glycosyltransferase family 4 protein [Gammaproteobacteria bacterium]
MHIGIDYRPVSVAPFSGIGRQVKGLEAVLQGRDNTQLSLLAVVPEDHPLRAKVTSPEWTTPLAGLQQPHKRLRFEAGFIPRALADNKIDLYIATANMGLPIGRKNKNTRLALLLHDLFQLTEDNHHTSKLKASVYRVLDRLSIAWSVYAADQIWCPSKFTAEQVKNKFPAVSKKVRVLNNLVSEFTADTEPLEQLPQNYWLIVGTREPRKNIKLFIQVWMMLRSQMSVPDLVLVGSSDDCPEYRHATGIHWLSGITEGQLHTAYRNAASLWQPSYAEGFGLPVIEALSVGTPVVTALGSALDEITPEFSPRFDPYSFADLEKCMREVGAHPLLKNQIHYTQWSDQYTYAAYQKRVNQLILELS